MAGGAKSKGGGSKLPPNQRTLGSFFGASATKPKPRPKPKSSGDESGKAARTSSDAAAAAERSAHAAAAAPPDTPGTEPCSPETPAVGASIKKRENNGEKNNKSSADVPAAMGKPSSSSALQDSDDDADADYADDGMMQTPVNKTAFKRLGSGGGSNQKRGDTSKGSGGKRLVIDDSGDDIGDDANDDANNNNRIPKEYSRSPTKFIDRRVAKVFNNEDSGKPEIFLGEVTDYTPAADSENKKPFWHVLFDDGDEEDWHWEDLDNALSLYRREGHQLDDAVPGKRKVIDASEDEGEDGATDNDGDAYRPTDDGSSMEDASSSDLDEVAPKKPARKKVKTASSPSRSKSTDAISTATSSAAIDTAASLPSAKRKPEEESGAASTSSAPKKAKPAASTSEPKAKKKSAAGGWDMFKRQNSAQIKAGSKSKKKKSTGGRGGAKSIAAIASTGDKPIRAYVPQNPDLEIISNPQEMFNDMIFEKLAGKDKAILDPLLKVMAGRPLKVATMCSGTESPVLALDMLSNAIEEFYLKYRRDEIDLPGAAEGQPVFQVEHVFSCEIEPFKQSYIERNFCPPLLFRDIRELGNERAATAYGTLAPVPNTPGTVDMLVAGTSCVDFSNLNNSQKELDEKGESGQTFRGMLDWVKKAQPPIVILENVSGAPFETMTKLMEECGYYSTFIRVDSKRYYIPQTRQRGYVVAVKKGRNITGSLVERWKDQVKALEREASGSLDEYVLPGDDPAVLRGRASLVANGSAGGSKSKTEWVKCESRHLLARSKESLGEKRPFTGWSDSNPTSMPGWNDWAEAQVHRIHDLLDINTLRLAKQGVDCTYKTMIWDVSQNVDRDTMGKLGLSQCLTPSGVNYVPRRGGPLVGEELLLLQGIPAEDLLLTRESDKMLKDLAGNAMTTTVVGACILSALTLGHQALANETPLKSVGEIVGNLVPRVLSVSSRHEVETSCEFGDYQQSPLSLEAQGTDGSSLGNILAMASSSARRCLSEGAHQILSNNELVVCADCGVTSSRALTTPPRKYEEHCFVSLSSDPTGANLRSTPADFRKVLLPMLPMRISINGFDIETVETPVGISPNLWKQWTKAFNDGLAPSEFRFSELVRSHIWTARYVSSSGCRLELRLSESEATWYLFAKAPARQGLLRDALTRPVARMFVESSGNEGRSFSFLRGEWEICLPTFAAYSVTMKGEGARVDSWQTMLGLKSNIGAQQRFERLSVSLNDDAPLALKSAVEGTYQLLPKCGTAAGSLHKRVAASDSQSGDMYFFLDSGRCTLPTEDSFVFSSSKHRTSYGEHRPIELQIDPSFSINVEPLGEGEEDRDINRKVKGTVPGEWKKVREAKAEATIVEEPSTLSVPSTKLDVQLSTDGWKKCPELLKVSVPMREGDALVGQCQNALSYVATSDNRTNSWIDVNVQKSGKVFDSLAFVTARLPIPTQTHQWNSLDTTDIPIDGEDGDYTVCAKCAPLPPSIQWAVVTKGKKKQYLPQEDGREAAAYERAIKSRPSPFNIQLRLSATGSESESLVVNLRIGLNAVALTQSALGLFPRESYARKSILHDASQNGESKVDSGCIFEWRVQRHIDDMSKSPETFPKLILSSNKKDKPAAQPPNFEKYHLRPEQLRSLSWMLSQESTDIPFYEEEDAEGILPKLGWRAEGRVRRPVMVRGGLIADEVGYGKTAITLGLIDAAPAVNGHDHPVPKEYRSGFFATKASLIVVPSHLAGQWPNEIKKFLGGSKNVVSIKSMADFNKKSIADIQQADIVIVNFSVLSSEKYFERLARLAGVNSKSFPTGNAKAADGLFNTVYKESTSKLEGRVQNLKADASSVYAGIVNDALARQREEEVAEAGVRRDGKKTVYATVSEEQTKNQGEPTAEKEGNSSSSSKKKGKTKEKSDDKKPYAKDLDPWDLSKAQVKNDVGKMKCPPLELFHWERLVLDEFHYILEKNNRSRVCAMMLGLKARSRWCLSGTPPHANFDDVQGIAALLGVHLGKSEPLPGQTASNLQDGQSSFDAFSSLLEVKSMQWHERRHEVAQGFLDRFLRQNRAEIDEIKWEENSVVVDMPPAERAIYLEMESYLAGLEMNSKGAMKSKKKSRGDRELRMADLLESANSGEEALLKRCAHFDLSSGSTEAVTALEICNRIANLRQRELDDTKLHLKESLVSALRQRTLIEEKCPGWTGANQSEKGEVEDRLAAYNVDVEKNRSVPGGADDDVHNLISSILREAESEVSANPEAEEADPIFEDANRPYFIDEKTGRKKENSDKDPDQLIFDMKYALREHVHTLRALGKELSGRKRSGRYFNRVSDFQRGKTVVCQGKSLNCICNKNDGAVKQEDSGVLSSCGHVGCLNCLNFHAARDECIDPSCKAPTKVTNVISAKDLGTIDQGDEINHGSKYGAKLTEIVNKVKMIVKDEERCILFVQFQDLKDKIAEALENNGVKSLQVKGSVNQQIKALDVMQKEVPGKEDPRVLLLTMDDESSAGVNLTTCNHAIFVHPLLAETQQQYEAYETQAIGRVRRYGQTKTVYITRYFARDTIDGKIYKERTGVDVNKFMSTG